MKKIISLLKKIPAWIKISGFLSSLIVALIFLLPIKIYLKAIYIFLLNLLDISIPDIILLSISILALLFCIKKCRGKTGSTTKIVLKYPQESILLLEGLAGRTDGMLEKRSIIGIFTKIYPVLRTADIQILLTDLCSHDLINYSTSFYGDDDREYYNITKLGFEYLYEKTRKAEAK
jgi:hypothetical protein